LEKKYGQVLAEETYRDLAISVGTLTRKRPAMNRSDAPVVRGFGDHMGVMMASGN
jgi:hypothetical protein